MSLCKLHAQFNKVSVCFTQNIDSRNLSHFLVRFPLSALSHAFVPIIREGYYTERLTGKREGGRNGCSFNSRVNPGQ